MSLQRKPQLRVCSVCRKPGHNKSRCPEYLKQIAAAPPSRPPVTFIIHDSNPYSSSPHLVNLKKQDNLWEKVGAEIPETSNDWYNFYHSLRENENTRIPLSKKEITRETDVLAEPVDELDFDNEEDVIELPVFTAREKPVEKEIETKPELTDQQKSYFFWRRLTWQTAAIALLIFIPFKANTYYQKIKIAADSIAANGTAGFMALQESTSAIMQADIAGAESSVNNALQKFSAAITEMNSKYRTLQKIASVMPVVSNEVQSRQNIITAGQKISQGNAYLIKGLSESQKNVSTTFPKRIKIITEYLDAAIPSYEASLEDLGAIDPGVLPLDYQAPFKDFRLLFAAFLNDMKNLSDLGSIVSEIFGGEGLRRYLVVFQNEHEIRPTGGFLGSFAIIDIKDGNIEKIDIPAGGSYDLQGQLNEHVEPPTPLLLSNKRWEFQDANWFPNFPTTAEKLMWFYRHSRDLTVDGVIAINASVLERLLAIVGPIVDEKRNITIASEDVLKTIQQVVEEGPEKKINKPKQILADLAPKFIGYLANLKAEQMMPLLVNLTEALEQKEIQAYFNDEQTENVIKSFGWGGEILPIKNEQDYLMVVNTNIQGQKSDAEIKQTISHQAVVSRDGTVVDTVVISRTHNGDPGVKLYGQTNIDYIRVYVPEGSKLISAGGFIWPDEKKFRAPDPWSKKDELLTTVEKEVKIDNETGTRITNEFGKTAFGNWIILEPGETKQIQFTYSLPFKVPLNQRDTGSSFLELIKGKPSLSPYQLIVQRQSGQESGFESQIIYPSSWRPSWTDGPELALAANGATIGPMDLKTDAIWSFVMASDN